MSDVFISYKRRLRPQVERIASALRDLRIDVWFDAALEPGVSFSAEISHEVRNAGCVLVCWSDDAFPHGGDENGWVLGEASIGRKRGRLVTVMLEETEFDPPWNMIHSERLVGFDPADYTADRSAWRAMLGAIGRLIERPGLSGYDRAVSVGTPAALKSWVQMYPDDPLAESVWAKVEEIELATVRKRLAEERVQQVAEPVPDRVYAALPEITVEEPAAVGVAATAATPTAQDVRKRLLSPRSAVIIATVLCVLGAIAASLSIGTASAGPLFNTIVYGGPFAAMIVLSIALVLSGYLTAWRAVVLAITGYVGYFLAASAVTYLTRAAPSFGTEGADIFGGFTMGAMGALIVLVTLVMLARNPDLGRLIPIVLSGVLLIGVATALVMVIPGISLYRDNDGIWAAPVWYAGLGLVILWLLAEPRRIERGP